MKSTPLGAIGLGAREKLDNLIFVINCNLQRLDGPVRGNARIIDELEGHFRGAGWNVIKVVWGSDWDTLFARDHTGAPSQAHGRVRRRRLPGASKPRAGPTCARTSSANTLNSSNWSKDMSDEQLARLHRGGHDPVKIYNAYKRAMEHKGGPTVILAKTVKGYGIRPQCAGPQRHAL